MKRDRSRYVPLGLTWESEIKWILSGLMAAGLFSLGFPIQFSRERSYLYELRAGQKVLRTDMVMADFRLLLFRSHALTTCFLLAGLSLFFIAYHYAYHTGESKTLYLMRRLPTRWELWRRCITVPILATVSFLLFALLLTLVHFAIYMLFTPEACLAPGQWAMLWGL